MTSTRARARRRVVSTWIIALVLVAVGVMPSAARDGEPQDAVPKTSHDPATAQPTPTPSPSGGPAAAEARNVRLCLGDAAGPECSTTAVSEAGGEHLLTALVTDEQAAPVAGVPVELRETGPGSFLTGGDAAVVRTDADGIARAAVTAATRGTSSVVAEISPAGLPGGFRGPGASDDECEQPGGSGGSPPPGNCISAPVTIEWIPEDFPPCADGIDNDEDGFTDEEDPGCDDGTEEPYNGAVVDNYHLRQINMRFRHRAGAGSRHLVIFGRVRPAAAGEDFRACIAGQPVRIQRRVGGRWVTKAVATTSERGRYRRVVRDVEARYRAVALRAELFDDDDRFHVCRKAAKAKPHRHPR
ncbi:MAG: Ig-like domain-containing protein [Actinomycetota bacterium]